MKGYLILLAIVFLSFECNDALECYSCNSVTDITTCTNTTTCGPHQACFHHMRADASGKVIDTGCKDRVLCVDGGSSSVIGRGLQLRQLSSGCSECCSTERCNDQLCSHNLPSACTDDETVDCAKLNSLFNVCTGNYEHAALVCPRFCDLCNFTNGNWADWSNWSECAITCGSTTQLRTRTCTNPSPSTHGKQCEGPSTNYKTCSRDACPVDGGWGSWDTWGLCSATCGVGIQHRNRFCDNPPPARFGDHCFGDAMDDRICVLRGCNDGGWSTWSNWSTCSATCGDGIHIRNRECTNPPASPYGHQCIGPNVDTSTCSTQMCPQTAGGWTLWTSWSSCTLTCGWGNTQRYRDCTNPTPSPYGQPCRGPSVDIESCHTDECILVRLSSGRLEIYINQQWGTVCDDEFNTSAAQVACRMLGLPFASAQAIHASNGSSSMPIWLDDLQCSGSEVTLMSCTHPPIGTHNCDHREDVGVICS